MYVRVYAHSGSSTHMNMYVKVQQLLWMLSLKYPRVSLAWNSSSRLDWLARKPQGSICLHCPSFGITNVNHHIWLFVIFNAGSGAQNQVLVFAWQGAFTLSHLPSCL